MANTLTFSAPSFTSELGINPSDCSLEELQELDSCLQDLSTRLNSWQLSQLPHFLKIFNVIVEFGPDYLTPDEYGRLVAGFEYTEPQDLIYDLETVLAVVYKYTDADDRASLMHYIYTEYDSFLEDDCLEAVTDHFYKFLS